MEKLYKSSEKMKTAQGKALDRLKAMSFEDLMALSEKNKDSSTGAFLTSLNTDAQYYNHECIQTTASEAHPTASHKHTAVVYAQREMPEYIVATSNYKVFERTIILSQQKGRFGAAILGCTQAFANLFPDTSSSSQDEGWLAAAA